MKNILLPILGLMVVFTSLCHAQNFTLWGMANYDGTRGYGDIFNITPTGIETDVHNFGNGTDGQYPWGSLIRASNGLIYGMTGNGGADNLGIIFSYNISTNNYTDIHDFGSVTNDGLFPLGSLIQASDGKLYGMTQSGGANDGGMIFSYNISTGTYSDIYDFSIDNNPQGSLIQASNNLLYGMTQFGGADTAGIIFSYNISTGTFTDLYDFKGDTTDGRYPLLGSFLPVNDSLLFGMTSEGGANYGPHTHSGVIFCYNILTGKEAVLHGFGIGADGSYPEGSLIQANNNLLYGMTSYGGANTYYGMIFSYDISTGSYADVHDFGDGTDGQDPFGALFQAKNGLLYGMTREGGANSYGEIFTYTISSGNYNDIHDFTGNDGAYTYGSLIEVDPVYVTPLKATICAGDSIALMANGATTYTWSPSIALSATAGGSVIASPTVTTTYTVIGTKGVNSDTLSVTITVTNVIINVNTPLPVCSGESATLIANGAATYTWVPSTGLNATTGSMVIATPTVTTVYSVTGINSSGCTTTETDTVKVGPTPPFTILPLDTTLCNGQKTTLYVRDTGTGFIWSPAFGLDATAGDSVVASPTTTTTYTISGIDSVGCASTGADVVTIIPSPNKPIFSQNGNVLTSSSEYDNQWYRNDTLLVGDTSQNLIITIGGEYRVTVTNEANGCSTSSDSMNIKTTGINQLSAISSQLSVYPNPFSSDLFIKINSRAGDINDWSLQVTDVLGQTVYSKQVLNYDNDINLSNLPGGMYFITVVNKTNREVFSGIKLN